MDVTNLLSTIALPSIEAASSSSPALNATLTTSPESTSATDRVSLSSVLSDVNTLSSQLTEQGTTSSLALATIGQEVHGLFDRYSSNGQGIHGHHHGGHHHGNSSTSQTPTITASDAQDALTQLTSTLSQQADADGTVSKATLNLDLQQLFHTLRSRASDQSTTGTVSTVA